MLKGGILRFFLFSSGVNMALGVFFQVTMSIHIFGDIRDASELCCIRCKRD